ncbi:MAG: hypothetical protein KAI66_28275, partial [Lentisphaeria bacterium]|nr:hypothetical protein [Lentisphaeria bacterium]
MNFRSIAIALFAVVVLSLSCYFNDYVIRQGYMVNSLMPTIVYGTLIFVLLCINPLLKKWKFSGRELAVIVALVLIACGIPGWGLVQYLPNALVLPHHNVRTHPGWAREGVVDMVPKRMLVDVSSNESRILDGFVTGLANGDEMISPAQVPWGVWVRPLLVWVPLLLSITIGLLGLAAVFHTQWAHHEQLPYPIAIFAHSLLPGDDETRAAIFGNRLFLSGFLVTFLITLNNYLCLYWPDVLIPFSLRFDFSPLAPHFDLLVKGLGRSLFYPRLNFMI